MSMVVMLSAVVTVAYAATPKLGSIFMGSSAHKRYALSIQARCSGNCKKATRVGIQVTAGNPKHRGGKCPYGVYQLNSATIKDGKFSVKGRFLAKGKLGFEVSGTFTSVTKVRGRISGPKACGGSEGYSLKAGGAGTAPGGY